MDSTQTKDCPFCGEQILVQAIKCKHCKSDLASGTSSQTSDAQQDEGSCVKAGLGCLGILLLLGGILLGIGSWFL